MNTLYRTENRIIVCDICDMQIVSGNDIHILYPHIGMHMNAFVKDIDRKGYARLDIYSDYVGFMWVVNIFPQLCLIQPISSKIFVNLLENVFADNSQTIYSLNNLFNPAGPFHPDLKVDVMDVITSMNYQCGLCGGNYDCGLPSVEIATKHALKCYENLNRPIIK